MITFLASPKPFIGNTKVIQQRAIASWKALHPDVEIILYGTGTGVAETANEMDLIHIPNIETTEFGTPYLNAMTSHASLYGKHDTQAFINCDIILVEDVITAISNISFSQYLLSNCRVNLPANVTIDVTLPGWKENLFSLARTNRLNLSCGSDIFIFKRNFFDQAPSLIIGRGGIDNGICAYALRRRVPLIDATRSITCLHQFHNYEHVNGGRTEVFEGKENLLNSTSYGDWNPHIRDGNWIMADHRLTRTFGQGDWFRAFIVTLVFRINSRELSKVLIEILKLVRRIFPSPMHITRIEEALLHLGYGK